MRARNDRGRRSSYPQIPDVDSPAAVATIWSVFYFLAAAVAITQLLISAGSNLLPDRCWAANDNSLRIPRFISLHDGWQFFRGVSCR